MTSIWASRTTIQGFCSFSLSMCQLTLSNSDQGNNQLVEQLHRQLSNSHWPQAFDRSISQAQHCGFLIQEYRLVVSMLISSLSGVTLFISTYTRLLAVCQQQ